MSDVVVTIQGENELLAKFENLNSRARAEVRNAIVDMQFRLQGVIRELLSGEVLNPRTGLLRNSITVSAISDDGNTISGSVGANTPYAAIQEYGGTIVPKNAQFLTVPLEAVLTGAGVARYTAPEIIDSPSLGGFTGTFFAKGVLFGKVGEDITPLFALKSSVTIPARPYMSTGLSQIQDEVQTRLAQALTDAAA